MKKLFFNISKLYGAYAQNPAVLKGAEMANCGTFSNAWISVENGIVMAVGSGQIPTAAFDETVDMQGMEVMPGFVDSHTHCVFAKSREEEFVMRIEGKSYEEISANGGGILNSASKLAQASEEALFEQAKYFNQKMIAHGTTCLEIKSGYGLSVESELKMLRVIKKLKQEMPIEIKATFLGAHAFPTEYKTNHEGYIDLIINKMLPTIAEENLADFIDVFCDRGFYSPEETNRILEAGKKYNLQGKIHANELGITGGVQAAVANQCYSADHLEHIGEDEILALQQSEVMPVGLPGTSYFLGLPYTPVRDLMAANLPFALASDFNPGSSPGLSMQMVWSLACTQMKTLPVEAFNAITLNAARSMRLEHTHGSISPGCKANFVCTSLENSIQKIPYFFGINHVEKVYLAGDLV